ncbi:phosphoglucosamine mutase [Mediterraneibacter butyricigenes]|uniref:Phosphoglucosamine mutase n=1 Tax=Mediterraneibacter butyricigenes TaxID=2316025 RepID=A0A391P9U2_9FIRM|nr:phosphoglucosamine mutase [Mediterraneibacter butyricigenes]RGV98211.1 phosphoglucosamine mutase [Ruminococcus sp. AF14-10]GCA67728.1 phosphoglucosamine mutase [Mediterraneibacter butyricigenes]
MGKYFGTDGFRGEANVVLTVEHAFKVGRFLGWYFGKEHKARIVIGKDTRRSSYMFEDALSAGLTASGADAYLLHVTTTPSVSYVVRTEDFDCGIMISASHNPFYDNGIKVINGMGHKMEAEVEEQIEAYIDGEIGELPLATRENIGRTVDYAAGRNRYIGHLISLATRSFKDTKIGLDCSNGSASSIAKSVFDALGAKTYVINSEPDGTNINTNCGSTHIEVLQAYVKEKKLDVGFAYDGDADRCIAVDENGNVVDGDLILYVCGKYLMEQGKLEGNTIVTTVMSNLGLYKACDKIGMKYEQTAVGDKYVYENMLENGYILGGEQSGHIIFSKHARTGDGILTSLMIMEVLMEKKTSLGRLTEEVKIYPQLLENVRVKDKKTARENPEVVKAVEAVAKELGSDGRILVRESGTEPLIRVMVEAATDEICAEQVKKVVDVIKAQGLCE